MNIFFKDVFGLASLAEGVYARIRRVFVPPKAYSWQTLIYLSLFSWLMSSLAADPVRSIIAFFGWIFLIAGTAWYTTDNPLLVPGTNLPVGALITGFLVSVFAFGNKQQMLTSSTIVFWPTISAIITAIPEFFEGTGTEAGTRIPKQEERPRIVVLVACSMIISCWLQLYFTVDNWLNEYPSVQADKNFHNSSLIVTWEASPNAPENGIEVLKEVKERVKEQLTGRRWSEAERWLLDAKTEVDRIGEATKQKSLSESKEKDLWMIQQQVQNNKTGYKLDLLNIWKGPSSHPQGYYLQESCQIDPVAASADSGSKVTLTEIICDPKIIMHLKLPPAQH